MATPLQEQQDKIAAKLSQTTMDEIYRAVSQLCLRHPAEEMGTEDDRNTYILLLLESVAMMGFADALRAVHKLRTNGNA